VNVTNAEPEPNLNTEIRYTGTINQQLSVITNHCRW